MIHDHILFRVSVYEGEGVFEGIYHLFYNIIILKLGKKCHLIQRLLIKKQNNELIIYKAWWCFEGLNYFLQGIYQCTG